MTLSLLIDARNIIYRSVYANLSSNSKNNEIDSQRPHHAVLFLRQLSKILKTVNPTSVHMFWDAPRDDVWRRDIYKGYKDRSTSDYVAGLSTHLAETTAVVKDLLHLLNVRQYEKERMEADDLIYATVTTLNPQKMIIVSSDSDMTQISYKLDNCSIYDPKNGGILPRPSLNPIHLKSLAGDKADSIKGYRGIGPKKSAAILTENRLQQFLATNGYDIFHNNTLLVDLSLCPALEANKEYIRKQLKQPVEFSSRKVSDYIITKKIAGLYQEYLSLINPFRSLV